MIDIVTIRRQSNIPLVCCMENLITKRRLSMKKRVGWFTLGILLLTIILAGSAPAQNTKITVMNPRGIQPPIRLIPMPERGSIEGKTIYVVDTKYPNTRPFVNELYKILQEKYPKTNWVFRDKIGSYFDDDPKLWAEIKEKGHGMVMPIGH